MPSYLLLPLFKIPENDVFLQNDGTSGDYRDAKDFIKKATTATASSLPISAAHQIVQSLLNSEEHINETTNKSSSGAAVNIEARSYTALQTSTISPSSSESEGTWINLHFHVERLWRNLETLYPSNLPIPDEAPRSAQRPNHFSLRDVQDVVLPVLQLALKSLEELNESLDRKETKGRLGLRAIVWIIPPPSMKDKLLVYSYLTPFREQFKIGKKSILIPSVDVGIFGEPRRNPNVKDWRWPISKERIEIEGRRHLMVNGNLAETGDALPLAEMILWDQKTGDLYEGTVTNFWVILIDEYDEGDGSTPKRKRVTLQTAPLDKVLVGTITQSILDLATSLKANYTLQVVQEFPRIDQAHLWEGCFLTNAYRVIQPIKSIHVLDRPETLRKFADCSLINQLHQDLTNHLSICS